jgi:sugar phosphate isomerase/epimerase
MGIKIFVLATSLKRTQARRNLALSDMPRFIVQQGFAGLEVSDRQFAGRCETELRRFAATCSHAGCGLLFDINADLTAEKDERYNAEITHARSMIAVAALLGAKRLRICIGGQSLSVQRFFRRRRNRPCAKLETVLTASPLALFASRSIMRFGHAWRENLPARVRGQERKMHRAIEALRLLAAEAGARGLYMGIENHWGISGDPDNIVRIITAVDNPWLGSCPDLGNFSRGVDVEAGLRRLARHAVILHAKSYGFAAGGEEKRIDYARLLPIFSAAGFAGPVTVEFEGFGDDLAGSLKTRALVLRHWPSGSEVPG